MTDARVVVVGGGISGLAAAHRLVTGRRRRAPVPDVLLLEAADRVGGKLRSIEVGGLALEAGADSFVVRKPWAMDLCTELGLADDLVVPAERGASVWTGGRLVPFPEHAAFGIPPTARALLGWHGLSPAGRRRALRDLYARPRRGETDESLGALLERRLGPEAARVMVGPLLAGIFAADPARLSVQATFPELAAWERGYESLIRGSRAARKAASKERLPMFATVWGGLTRLTEALAIGLGEHRIRRGAVVDALRATPAGFEVQVAGDRIETEAVVLATPAFEAGRLLREVDEEAAGLAGDIGYASTAVVELVFPEGTAERLPAGTGYVAPPGEGSVTASTWVSRKWPREEFGSRAVVRCFVGRVGDQAVLDLADGDLLASALGDLRRAVPGLPDPEASAVVRWPRSMPQYEVGHLDRLAALDRAIEARPGLFVTGAAYRGVGISDCVRQAGETAERVRDYLGGRGTAGPAGAPVDEEAITWTT